MGVDPPLVSVIIPAHNAARHLRGCLETVLPTAQARNWEVLVVDDASTDGTADLAAEMGVETLRLATNEGVARARNAGAKSARGDILVFLDADIRASAATLDALVDRLAADPGVHATGGYPEVGDLSPEWGAHFVGLRAAWGFQCRPLRDVPGFSTIQSECGAFRREVFERLGGFPDYYTGVGMEEYALAHTMERAGYVNILLATAPYRHHFKALWPRARVLVRRAMLWVPLLVRRRRFESPGAVGTPHESLSCLVSWLWPAAAAAGFWTPWAWAAGGALIVLQAAIESRFLGFARRVYGWKMALYAWPALQVLHWAIGIGFVGGLFRAIVRKG